MFCISAIQMNIIFFSNEIWIHSHFAFVQVIPTWFFTVIILILLHFVMLHDMPAGFFHGCNFQPTFFCMWFPSHIILNLCKCNEIYFSPCNFHPTLFCTCAIHTNLIFYLQGKPWGWRSFFLISKVFTNTLNVMILYGSVSHTQLHMNIRYFVNIVIYLPRVQK